MCLHTSYFVDIFPCSVSFLEGQQCLALKAILYYCSIKKSFKKSAFENYAKQMFNRYQSCSLFMLHVILLFSSPLLINFCFVVMQNCIGRHQGGVARAYSTMEANRESLWLQHNDKSGYSIFGLFPQRSSSRFVG